MIDIFHVHTFTVRKAASLITADIYMPSIDKKGSVKTVTLFVCRTEKNQPELEIQTAVFILHSRLRLQSQKPKAWSEPLPWQCQS